MLKYSLSVFLLSFCWQGILWVLGHKESKTSAVRSKQRIDLYAGPEISPEGTAASDCISFCRQVDLLMQILFIHPLAENESASTLVPKHRKAHGFLWILGLINIVQS